MMRIPTGRAARPVLRLALAVTCVALLFGCATGPGPKSRSDGPMAYLLERSSPARDANGWQVDCVIDAENALHHCFAGKYGSDLEQRKKVPFLVSFYQIVPGGGFLGPTAEPGLHTSADLAPTVRVDTFKPVSDMSSGTLLAQLKTGSTMRARYHSWPSEPAEMTLSLAGFDEAYDRLLDRVRSVARLYRVPDAAEGMIGEDDIALSAEWLVNDHGPRAGLEAAERAEGMLRKGDIKGFTIWTRIGEMVEESHKAQLDADDITH